MEKDAEKRQLLDEAIQHLSDADRYLTNDWANTCDIASAHFRLGVVDRASHSKPDGEFQKAVDLLQRVIDELRPDYGFAHYELGRIYRVWERFDDAVASCKESLLIPVQYRDVGDATVNNELIRAQKHDSTFP